LLCVTEQLAGQVDGDDAAAEPVATADQQPPEPKRVSKWDRPPEPHDWRFYVGGLGKILITTGLLMFGFVAYQLWGTGIETARAQNKLENQFEEFLVEAQTSTTAPTTVAPTTAPTATVPSSTASSEPGATIELSPAATSSPPESAFPTTAPAPVEQDIPPIERGQVLAKLEIPKIGKEGGDALYVVPGVSLEDLKKGPGHYPETPLPGQLGNASIAGHRTTFGEPFRHIDELEPGDQIIVTMLTGDQFVYEVASTEVVGPDDYFVVTTTDPDVAELTLTSCDPVYTARNRIAVHAFLVTSESDPIGEPTFYDLEANGNVREPVRDDDPAVRPDDTDAVASSGDAATVDAGSAEATGTTDAAPADTTPDATVPVASGQVQDAFADGWFHDRGAWPQIALWGGALILIAIAVRKISRHFRHDSIGIAIGIIPFVICLYFFYQNVNRLLPPGF
jgi:sortase A